MLRLFLERISDPYTRDQFQKVFEYVRDTAILRGEFKFFSYTFTKAETNYRIPHGLGFLPLDVLQTSLTGAGTLTWNYTLFTDTYLDVTTSAACVVRAFIGRYGETEA